jgi:hypothetical protein
MAENRRHWRLRTDTARALLTHYANRTDHIHPSLIHIAVNGTGLLDQLDLDLDEVHQCLQAKSCLPESLISKVTWYVGHFEKLIEELDARMRGIVQALDGRSDFILEPNFAPWMHFYNW